MFSQLENNHLYKIYTRKYCQNTIRYDSFFIIIIIIINEQNGFLKNNSNLRISHKLKLILSHSVSKLHVLEAKQNEEEEAKPKEKEIAQKFKRKRKLFTMKSNVHAGCGLISTVPFSLVVVLFSSGGVIDLFTVDWFLCVVLRICWNWAAVIVI